MSKRNMYNSIALIVAVGFIFLMNLVLDRYQLGIFNLSAIFIILGLSLNLINGFTGLFSLGHAGFMAIGAYATALLTMTPEMKAAVFFSVPITPALAEITLPFPVALLIGGLLASLAGAIIGAPILRLKDDYLAIATLGFGEIIRVIITNAQNVTNGALGLKGIPPNTNTFWAWGIAILTVLFMKRLIDGMYGKALKAIREDEIAAQSMGVNLFKHKMLSFIIGSFFAGVGGGLLASMITSIDPKMFTFLYTFNILLIVVLGGIGSISGTCISAVVVTILMEVLRVIEKPLDLGFLMIPGIPGMRMVIFSTLLMGVILFYPKGLMGTNELDWDSLFRFFKRKKTKEGQL